MYVLLLVSALFTMQLRNCIFLLTISIAYGGRILVVLSIPSVSHQQTLMAVCKALIIHGHTVTAITANPLYDETLTNLTEIDISNIYIAVKNHSIAKIISSANSQLQMIFYYRQMLEIVHDVIFESSMVKTLMNSKEEFDLIFVEAYDPVMFAFSWKFKAPIISK